MLTRRGGGEAPRRIPQLGAAAARARGQAVGEGEGEGGGRGRGRAWDTLEMPRRGTPTLEMPPDVGEGWGDGSMKL
jgi:hypothetical protein